MVTYLVRRAFKAAVIAAAGAAGAYVIRRVTQQRQQRLSMRDVRSDVSRWEGEGGSPAQAISAAPGGEATSH